MVARRHAAIPTTTPHCAAASSRTALNTAPPPPWEVLEAEAVTASQIAGTESPSIEKVLASEQPDISWKKFNGWSKGNRNWTDFPVYRIWRQVKVLKMLEKIGEIFLLMLPKF
ncbi:hypothetical protein Y1Q_0003996 [Alligator mississippiensis]|uniref:Uncharacterized protein n=1 Tax=Alligator mississippiensis TaxID=8496 RepID=A0A151PHR6_ALLMI|nr:hypothetical protein Y1Q_0003996 [Alligator mississippiensis]